MRRSDQTSSPPHGPDLLRGARAVLGWSLTEAGRRAAVSVSAIVTAEGRGVRSSAVRPHDLDKLRRAYEEAGVRFVDDVATGRGIRFEIR